MGLSLFEQDIEKISEQIVFHEKRVGSSDERPVSNIFLNGQRVLLQGREIGDSRYIYGENGHYYAFTESGQVTAQIGRKEPFIIKIKGEEPSVAFVAGINQGGSKNAIRFSLLPSLVMEDTEEEVVAKTVMGMDASYFFRTYKDFASVVRLAFDHKKEELLVTLLLHNTGNTDIDMFFSSYIAPYMRSDPWNYELPWFTKHTAEGGFLDDDSGVFNPGVLELWDIPEGCFRYGLLRGKVTSKHIQIKERLTNTSKMDFIGFPAGNLQTAVTFKKGMFRCLIDGKRKEVTTFNDIAVFSDLMHFSMPSQSKIRFDYIVSGHDNIELLEKRKGIFVLPNEIDGAVQSIQEKCKERFSVFDLTIGEMSGIDISGHDLSHFIRHVRYQTSLCSFLIGPIVTKSPFQFVGPRDVSQSLRESAFDEPEKTADKLEEVYSHMIVNGRSKRQYLPAKIASATKPKNKNTDLREFIDQYQYVITATSEYLKVTGDKDFLLREVGYEQIIDEAKEIIAAADSHYIRQYNKTKKLGEGIRESLDEIGKKMLVDNFVEIPEVGDESILSHMFRAMDYLDRNRDHETTKLLRFLEGDWNDAIGRMGLDANGNKFGNGVSIMASAHFYQNCNEMIAILKHFFPNEHLNRIAQYKRIKSEILEGIKKYALHSADDGRIHIVHGWTHNREFFVGSPNDVDGERRYSAAGPAFLVTSGVLEALAEDLDYNKLVEDILFGYGELDSPYGIRTFSKPFPRSDFILNKIGRIPTLPEGTAEHAATYIHGTLFAVLALFKMGQVKNAWEQLVKVMPFTSMHDNKYSHSRFVMGNSLTYNPKIHCHGQAMNDWQTGSSNVLLEIFRKYVVGIEVDHEGFFLQSVEDSPITSFDYIQKLEKRGIEINLHYKKSHGRSKRSIRLNGKDVFSYKEIKSETNILSGNTRVFIPYNILGEKNQIQIQ